MKMKQTECSEMSAYKIQMPGNYPEESIQHSEHGKSLKSIISSNLTSSVEIICIRGTLLIVGKVPGLHGEIPIKHMVLYTQSIW
jgi:hypothetical protein